MHFKVLIITFLVVFLTACNSLESRLSKKWTLTEISGKNITPAVKEAMFVDSTYFDLLSNGTFTGLWYSSEVTGELTKISGTWFASSEGVNDGFADLFLTMEGDNMEILTITELNDTLMVYKLPYADSFYLMNFSSEK